MAFMNWLENQTKINLSIMESVFIGLFFLLVPATVFKLLSSNVILHVIFQLICSIICLGFIFIAMRKWMHKQDDLD